MPSVTSWCPSAIASLAGDAGRSAAALLNAALHQAAHALAAARGVNDTSMRGYYHNNRYRNLAEEVGLVVAEQANRGWAATALSDDARSAFSLGAIAADLRGGSAWPLPKLGTAQSSRNYLLAVCGCPRRMRMSRSDLAKGPVLCSLCGELFTVTDA